MSSEQLDQLLTDWTTRLDLASQNILALQELFTYQRLAGEAGLSKASLTGTTDRQVAAALDAMNQVFQHFDLLRGTIAQALALRKQIPRFLASEEKFKAIESLLTGPSIQLPVIQVPLAQRSLLSTTETVCTISPDDLLAMMTRGFEVARDTILAVDTAWSTLEPALAQVETEIQTLQHRANTLGGVDCPALTLLQQAIVPLRDRIMTDPLGVHQDFDQHIRPLIQQAQDNLGHIAEQYDRVQTGLAAAHRLFQELLQCHQQVSVIYREGLEKLVDHTQLCPPLPEEQLEALEQWLTRLDTRFRQGLIQPIPVGLERWTDQAQAAIVLTQTALAQNRQPLDTRLELRGRLEALKAKALAKGRAEDPQLSALATQIQQILYTRPTNLAQAIALVGAYEQQLR